MKNKIIIILKDTSWEFPPIYLTQFKDGGFGTTPNRNDAFVCDEDCSDQYLKIAENICKHAMTFAGLPIEWARKAEKQSVVVLENQYKKEII